MYFKPVAQLKPLLKFKHMLKFLPELEPHKALTGTDSNRFIVPSLQCYSLEDEVYPLKGKGSSNFAVVEFLLKCIINFSPRKEPLPHVFLCPETWLGCDWLDPVCTCFILYAFKFLLSIYDLFGLLFYFNKVPLLTWNNHHNESSKLSWP